MKNNQNTLCLLVSSILYLIALTSSPPAHSKEPILRSDGLCAIAEYEELISSAGAYTETFAQIKERTDLAIIESWEQYTAEEAKNLLPQQNGLYSMGYARYERYLAESGMSDEAKQKLIDQLWAVAVDFVALAHNRHPVQAVIASFFEDADIESCGQDQRSDTGVTSSAPIHDIFEAQANYECVSEKPSSKLDSVRVEEESEDAIR